MHLPFERHFFSCWHIYHKEAKTNQQESAENDWNAWVILHLEAAVVAIAVECNAQWLLNEARFIQGNSIYSHRVISLLQHPDNVGIVGPMTAYLGNSLFFIVVWIEGDAEGGVSLWTFVHYNPVLVLDFQLGAGLSCAEGHEDFPAEGLLHNGDAIVLGGGIHLDCQGNWLQLWLVNGNVTFVLLR